MTQECNQDVIAIREWLSKEPHMPQDFDDHLIKKFLHSCYGSLEKTKKCLDRFCTTRSQMTDVYTARDPMATHLQTAFSATVVSNYDFEDSEIIIHKYDDPTIEKFSFYDLLKSMSIQADHWILYRPLPEGHYVVIDMEYYSLKMIPKMNIMFLRDFVLYLLEGMPIRMKKVFVINAPSYYETMYALIKPVIPSEICDIIHFFPDYKSLYKFIDKKYLPAEYGGDAESMYELNQKWLKKIEEDRKIYLNEDLWKADLKLKPKKNGCDNTMNGSFRSLSID